MEDYGILGWVSYAIQPKNHVIRLVFTKVDYEGLGLTIFGVGMDVECGVYIRAKGLVCIAFIITGMFAN